MNRSGLAAAQGAGKGRKPGSAKTTPSKTTPAGKRVSTGGKATAKVPRKELERAVSATGKRPSVGGSTKDYYISHFYYLFRSTWCSNRTNTKVPSLSSRNCCPS